MADSPLLYWPLQETSGSAQDATANNLDGTVTTGGLWVPANPIPSKGNKAFSIPAGLTDASYLSYTGTIDTNAGTGLSVEFLLRIEAFASAAAPILHSDTGSNKFAVTLSSTDTIRFGTSGSTGRISVAGGAVLGRWVYWAFTQDSSGSSRVYKNGVLVGGPSSQTVGADFPDIKVSNGTNATVATLWQHIAIFNTVLSDERIAARWAQLTDDLWTFVGKDQRPVTFPTKPLVPVSTGPITPPPSQGQLWPRGNN